jgi:MFS family permease
VKSTVRNPWAVWVVGLLVYLVAVFHRSSLAVAGLAASDRFDISASQLATFTMLQLVVYAAMQIPVGLLVDRFGSRSVLLCGTLLLTVAQAGFALAESYPAALVARVFVGMGDAMTFICVLRLVSSWFPARRIPLVTQLTGTLGQLGAVLAAVPMTWALGHLGWTKAYLVAASVGLVLAIAVLVVLHDSPTHRNLRGPALSVSAARTSLGASWAHPGTRLGFWMHFSTQFSATALSLLWGYPFFVKGELQSSSTAGLLLTLMVLAVMAAGPTLGWLVGNHPWHRSTMVLTIVFSIVVVWTAVLASASGIINQGGFIASLLLVIAIGFVLDWRTPGSSTDYTPSAFRWAMSTQFVIWAVGLSQVCRYRKQARRVINRAELEESARAAA